MTDEKQPPAPPTVAEVMAKLADPFPPEAVRLRRQGKVNNGKAAFVAYVDARTVAKRLNNVLGGDGWKTRMLPQPSGAVLCRLSVRFPGKTEWISREDVGGKSEQPDEDDQLKAAVSDALKRTAVNFGVGAYLYRLPRYTLPVDQWGNISEPWTLPQWALPEENRACGPNGANSIFKLANAYATAKNLNSQAYIADLLKHYGYKSDCNLTEVERRHARAMMQAINADIAAHAATPTAVYNTAAVSDKPLDQQGNAPADLPQNGHDLCKWLYVRDERCANEGLCPKNGLVTAILSEGAKKNFSTSIDEWTGQQIVWAVNFARDTYINWRSAKKNSGTGRNPLDHADKPVA